MAARAIALISPRARTNGEGCPDLNWGPSVPVSARHFFAGRFPAYRLNTPKSCGIALVYPSKSESRAGRCALSLLWPAPALHTPQGFLQRESASARRLSNALLESRQGATKEFSDNDRIPIESRGA